VFPGDIIIVVGYVRRIFWVMGLQDPRSKDAFNAVAAVVNAEKLHKLSTYKHSEALIHRDV